jgi:parallel beta-helix repeat protein
LEQRLQIKERKSLKRVVSGTMLMLLMASMLTLAFNIQPVRARTMAVPDNYPTIQQAINHANEEDVILVKAGTYWENVVVNKTISLLGQDAESTIIDGNMTSDCVSVTADHVKISGFTIRNGGSKPYTAYASIRLFSIGNIILNNILTGSWCGVWMEHYSDYNLIANNTIMENLNGIAGEIWHNTKILSNVIKNNLMGIWIGPYSQNNVISFNNITEQWSEGIMMMQSSNNTFEGNNVMDNNQADFWAGITVGFQKGFSSGNRFFHNNIANIGKQVELLQGESEPIIWDDGYPSGGNYWSDYFAKYPNATEIDRTGIGNTPYVMDGNNIDHYPLMKPWAPTRPAINATIDIDPDILNLKIEGQWISAYIELPKGYNVTNINVSTLMLNSAVLAELSPTAVEDHDSDGSPDLMVKFNRTAVTDFILSEGIKHGNVTLTITGRLYDGTLFEGSDVIRARMPGDVNCDGKVEVTDLAMVCAAFGSYTGHSRWNSIADENGDNRIDVMDIALVTGNFGKTYL